MRRPRVFAASIVAGFVLVAPRARAETSATDKAAAEALFDQGKKLLMSGSFAEACPKFAESQKLDPGVGTLLYLGDCYERTGRLASAWATFREAGSAALAAHDTRRAALAEQLHKKLEPLVPKLVLRVSEVPGLRVTDGETALVPALWASAIPVDPGDHVLVARAPGFVEWRATVHVDEGETKEVEVPALAKAQGEPAAPAPLPTPAAPAGAVTTTPPPPGGPSPRRVAGFVIGGIGLAGALVGAVGGGLMLAKRGVASSDCTNMANGVAECHSAAGVSAGNAAKTFGTVATVGWVTAAAGLGVGVALVATAPSSARAAHGAGPLRVGLGVSPTGASFGVQGGF